MGLLWLPVCLLSCQFARCRESTGGTTPQRNQRTVTWRQWAQSNMQLRQCGLWATVCVQASLKAHAASCGQRPILGSDSDGGFAETLREMLVAVWVLWGCRRGRPCSRHCCRGVLSASSCVQLLYRRCRQRCRRHAKTRLADFALRDLCNLAWAVRISPEVKTEMNCLHVIHASNGPGRTFNDSADTFVEEHFQRGCMP